MSLETLFALLPDASAVEEVSLLAGYLQAADSAVGRSLARGPEQLSLSLAARADLYHEAVLRIAEEGATIASPDAVASAAYTNLANELVDRGDCWGALPAAEAAVSALPLAGAVRAVARASYWAGQTQRAAVYYRRAADLALSVGDTQLHVIALTGLGNSLRTGGMGTGEEPYLAALAAIDQHPALDLVSERTHLLLNLSSLYSVEGDNVRAEHHARLAVAIAASRNDRVSYAHALGLLAQVIHLTEGTARSTEIAREALQIASEHDPSVHGVVEATILAGRAMLTNAIWDGDPSGLQPVVRAMEHAARRSGRPEMLAYACAAQGTLCSCAGNDDGALLAFTAAMEPHGLSLDTRLQALADLATHHATLGRFEAALGALAPENPKARVSTDIRRDVQVLSDALRRRDELSVIRWWQLRHGAPPTM